MTEELPQVIQSMFPVSRKREDTFIAGLSMGGYGAWYLALRRPDLYAAAASLSGAVDIGFRVTPLKLDEKAPKPFFAENCFGDLRALPGSDSDLIALYPRAAEKGLLPRLYQSCGTKDYLYYMNRLTHEKLVELGAEITYHEIPGMEHEWDCWDQEIRRVLQWIRQ
jgi:S-formylglutathione hydrolase FrmB